MKLFTTNQNKSERVLRFILSIFLIPAPIIYEFDPFSIVQSVVGGILLFNAISGMCVIYRFFGANTCKLQFRVKNYLSTINISQTSPTLFSSKTKGSSPIHMQGVPGKQDLVPADITLPSTTFKLLITPEVSPFSRMYF